MFIFATFMSLLMSGIMSFCITFYQFGFDSDLLIRFLGAWQFAFPFAFVVAQFVAPAVRKLTMLIVEC